MTIESITARYQAGRMTDALLGVYVKKGVVTTAQYKQITGKEYQETAPATELNEVVNILFGEEAQ